MELFGPHGGTFRRVCARPRCVWHDARMTRRVFIVAFIAAAWIAQASPAYAHAGRTPSVAVDDKAAITEVQPHGAPFRVRVVDGDQDLWLRLQPGNELIVLGSIGEPFLRFAHGSVSANTRSPTAGTDLFGVVPSRPSLNPHAPPQWASVAAGDSYLWHDHRLHALALLSGGGPPRRLGSWVIPLRLNGAPAAITGELRSVAPPQRWFWLAIPVALVAAALALLRLRPGRVPPGASVVATFAVLGVFVARTGRDLYGRPEITTPRYVSIAIGLVLSAFLLERLARGGPGVRSIVVMVAGVVGLVQGSTLAPVFWHGLVLAAIPSWIERSCVALAIGGGAAALLLTFAPSTEEPAEVASGNDSMRRPDH
jgi:hypothetical protein